LVKSNRGGHCVYHILHYCSDFQERALSITLRNLFVVIIGTIYCGFEKNGFFDVYNQARFYNSYRLRLTCLIVYLRMDVRGTLNRNLYLNHSHLCEILDKKIDEGYESLRVVIINFLLSESNSWPVLLKR
jgi:hypothetical protein